MRYLALPGPEAKPGPCDRLGVRHVLLLRVHKRPDPGREMKRPMKFPADVTPSGAYVLLNAGAAPAKDLVERAARGAKLEVSATALDAPHEHILSVDPGAKAAPKGWMPFAEKLSTDKAVRAVFLYLFDEEAGEEGVWRFEGGKLTDARRMAFDGDKELVALNKKETTRRQDIHAHVWRTWPISHLARELGLSGRLSIVSPQYAELLIDAEWPSDVGDELVQLPGLYVPKEMLSEIQTAARARGCSVSRVAKDVLEPLSKASLETLAGKPRLKSTEKRMLPLYLPKEFGERLQGAAVAADTSLSHVFQQAWVQRPR